MLYLKDIIKPGIKARFQILRHMGIRTVMITGNNPKTAAAITAEAGVDDFIAEATPEKKLAYIRQEQADGRLVAMCGDGANDSPALMLSARDSEQEKVRLLDAGANEYMSKPFGIGNMMARIRVLLRQRAGVSSGERRHFPQCGLTLDISSNKEDTHYLRIVIASLRKKLGDYPQQPTLIETESGIGYRFIGN